MGYTAAYTTTLPFPVNFKHSYCWLWRKNGWIQVDMNNLICCRFFVQLCSSCDIELNKSSASQNGREAMRGREGGIGEWGKEAECTKFNTIPCERAQGKEQNPSPPPSTFAVDCWVLIMIFINAQNLLFFLFLLCPITQKLLLSLKLFFFILYIQ